MSDNRLQHFFRKFRNHQRKVQVDDGGTLTTYPTGRTELSYASAPYGEHALNAFVSAKRHAAFLDQLKRDTRR
jgi:hypothetical protein